MVASNLIKFKQEIQGKKVVGALVIYAVVASEIALIAQVAGATLPLILFASSGDSSTIRTYHQSNDAVAITETLVRLYFK